MPDNSTHKTKRTPLPGNPLPLSASSHPGFIPPHGGHEKLPAYRKSEIIYDATVRFCDRFIDRKSRTHDQMVQAARSGNKNIAEGSQISGTSKEVRSNSPTWPAPALGVRSRQPGTNNPNSGAGRLSLIHI